MIKSSRLLMSVLASGGCLLAAAVPARPGLMQFTQSDGSQVEVRIIGDEWGHFYITPDSLLLSRDDASDDFYYSVADTETGWPVSSGIRYGSSLTETDRLASQQRFMRLDELPIVKENPKSSPVRAANPGLMPGATFPAEGHQKALVILVQYKDVKFTTSDAGTYFHNILNQHDYSDGGATGSARDWFIENSNHRFIPEFDVYGPVTLPEKMSWYGGNRMQGVDDRACMMAVHACQALDDDVDFSQYDRDGDGKIDNVFLFYAGRGENDGGPATAVWPHAWTITESTGVQSDYMFDGVLLDRYACSNEWKDSRPDGCGTFCHEFSHVLGLADLYPSKYTGAFTPGNWSAMDTGPYCNHGMTPPLLSAFERYALGWLEPVVISEPASISMRSIASNQAYMIPTEVETEFFMLENRQNVGWDSFLPGHGMLVWHVDYNPEVWDSNTVNNDNTHQFVDLEEADHLRDNATRAGDSFPGMSGITAFTDDTTPSMRSWSGKALGLPLTDITETADGMISFNVAGGAPQVEIGEVSEIKVTDISSDSAVISWDKPENANSYLVRLSIEGNPVRGYENHPAYGNELALMELHPETEYSVTVTPVGLYHEGIESREIKFATLANTEIKSIEKDSDWNFIISGRTLTVKSDGTTWLVARPDGMPLYSSKEPATLTLAPGIYILRDRNSSQKVIIR